MPNPLFNALMGRGQPQRQQAPNQPAQAPKITFQDAMAQLQQNPAEMIRKAGYNVPDEVANNPQAAVMHILQSGQVKGPVMQRIQPLLGALMGKRQ